MENKILIKPFMVLSVIIFLIASVFTTYFISNFLLKKQYETQQQADLIEITDLKIEVKQHQEQIVEFVHAQNDIRSYINELVELLYAKESYLPVDGIGGTVDNLITNEKTSLFQIKEVINNLQDDKQAMGMVKNYLISRRQFAESFPFIWPVPGGVPKISSGYGVRANEEVGNILGERPPGGIHFHAGIDIPGDLNDPIQATADGRIVWIEKNNPVYGKVAVIQHNYGFQTLYGHMNKLNIKVGTYVKRGDIIGYMGNTGASYGVHVHYEIKKNGYHIDPMDLLGLNM